jgi:hypothetical protein
MKYLLSIGAIALFTFLPRFASAQEHAQDKKAQWPEMVAFHEVMAGTFHPAEKGDLKPLREKAGLLLERAEAWKKSAVPAGYKAEQTAKTLGNLVKQCKGIKKAVKKEKSDKDLTALITNAHEVFHEVMEKCRD